MRILITGTSGFIGQNLKLAFKDKYELLTPNHQELDLLSGKKTEAYLKESTPDVVIHAANWNNTKRVASDYEVLNCNLQMFYNLLRCQNYYNKMLYFGSGAEYDKNRDLDMVAEDKFGEFIPADPYGFSKYIMAREALSSDKIYDLCLFGVFGKYEEYHRRFISNAICRSLFGLPITLSQNAQFDYLYIDDLCSIVEWFLLNTPKFHRYHITSGTPVALLSLAQIIKTEFNNEPDILVSQSGWKYSYTSENSRILKEVPNIKFTSIQRSIREMILYYESVKNQLDVNALI